MRDVIGCEGMCGEISYLIILAHKKKMEMTFSKWPLVPLLAFLQFQG